MTFTQQLAAHDYTKNELILSLFSWSYPNDYRLYCNLDDQFSRHSYSNYVSETVKEGHHRSGGSSVVDLLLHHPDYSPEEVMKLALSKCDYHDSRRFYWTFSPGPNSHYEYKYSSSEKHRYSFMLDLVKQHEEGLKAQGLLSFRKSIDHIKHKWYRGRIEDYLKLEKYGNRAELLISYPGNNVVNQIFSLEIYKEYLQYILDNNIVNDPHNKKLTYRPFGFKDYRNEFIIINLMEPMGGLIYLNLSEMMEIYKSIPRHRIPATDKAEWAYIQSLSKNNWGDVQFYINLEKR